MKKNTVVVVARDQREGPRFKSINSDLSTNDNKKSVKNKRIQKPSKQNGGKTVSRSGSVNNKEKIKFTNPQDQSANQNQNKTRHEQQQQQQQPKPQREKFQQPQQNASNQHQRQYTENNTKPQNFPQRGYSKKKGQILFQTSKYFKLMITFFNQGKLIIQKNSFLKQ